MIGQISVRLFNRLDLVVVSLGRHFEMPSKLGRNFGLDFLQQPYLSMQSMCILSSLHAFWNLDLSFTSWVTKVSVPINIIIIFREGKGMEDWVPISIHSGMALPYQGMPWMALTSKRKKMNDKWKVEEKQAYLGFLGGWFI